VEIPVIAVDDLIRMSERTDRPQDRADVYYLKKIKEGRTDEG
jgi:hypothetical protein